ncbi:hypothetical protein LOC68_05800 [Blastopirellula sp. JC732]|uniref:Uncharacterized protein n=1 Tax=Blastopirellula sediminis TaxID=2894196 RepID=A0A9X1MJY2_9BACT|nr:hypothetical protein [Blastopirellula sediminis]MCC9609322.1 hypothetical protein [Blastopirellula sediminis]MCC9627901.1 hypothetical protein [Blastopirellula sediminis]
MKTILVTLLLLTATPSLSWAVEPGEQDVAPVAQHGEIEPQHDEIYASPGHVLSHYFGRRRSGLITSGMENVVGVTATGLSPLMVLSVTGPVVYFMTDADQRGELFFFYQPWFWIITGICSLIVVFKDTILTFASYLKTPLNILGAIFNFVGFLFGFRLIIYLLGADLGSDPSLAEKVLTYATMVVMLSFYASIWIFGNLVEVIILLSPFPLVDTALRFLRIGVVVTMYVLCWIHPALGLMFALPILIMSALTMNRSLQALKLSARIMWDLVAWRSYPLTSDMTTLTAFTVISLPSTPWFTLGKLVKKENGWHFRYRRFLIGPRVDTLVDLSNLQIAKGTLASVAAQKTESGSQVILRFPPGYRGQEETLAEILGGETADWSAMTKIRDMWKNRRWPFSRDSGGEEIAKCDEPQPNESR